ncbi:MAG: SDR family oxidoreductase [Flavobacteriales bacterium]|nr:SDR family oxidoreductase [Flavobacteriales bacterium]
MVKNSPDFPCVLILGALSDVALALAEVYASEGSRLVLAARRPERLERIAKDLNLRFGVTVEIKELDVRDFASHGAFVESLSEIPDLVVAAFGYLGDQQKALDDFEEARQILEVNFVGAVSVLNRLALRMASQRQGVVAALASVAGLRGRMSNFHYGSAKAGLIAYLSGLRNWGWHHGVHVCTLIPGFIRTRMIAHMHTPGFLTLTPEQAAKRIAKAIRKRRNQAYIGPIWWWVMAVIRAIPEPLFKRLRL